MSVSIGKSVSIGTGVRRAYAVGRGGVNERAGGFSPLDNPGMKLWYDASDSSTVTPDTTRASDISNKIDGTATLSQATDADQPDYPRAINGLSALDFDGGDFMQNASGDVNIGSSQHLFTVIRADVLSNDSVTGNFVVGGTPWWQILLFSSGTIWLRCNDGSTTALAQHTSAFSAGDTLVLTMSWDGVTFIGRVNGTEQSVSTAVTPANATARWVIGNAEVGSNSAGLDGAFCEQWLCDKLSDEAQTQNEVYAAEKWGATLA